MSGFEKTQNPYPFIERKQETHKQRFVRRLEKLRIEQNDKYLKTLDMIEKEMGAGVTLFHLFNPADGSDLDPRCYRYAEELGVPLEYLTT